MNNWSAKSALTTKELECITSISNLFNQSRQQVAESPARAQEAFNKTEASVSKSQINGGSPKKDLTKKKDQEIESLIAEATTILQRQEKATQENLHLIHKIELSKGQVLASTKDFQQSCMAILKRERMLTKVTREIERSLQHYKDYEECYRILNHQQLMENPKELVLVLQKIQRGQSFFKENFDFKKADVFLRRFETLRDLALEKINLKTLRVIREANSENNLSVVQRGIFDKATKLEEVDLANMIYQKPRNVSQSNDFETVKMLISALEDQASLGSSGDF